MALIKTIRHTYRTGHKPNKLGKLESDTV